MIKNLNLELPAAVKNTHTKYQKLQKNIKIRPKTKTKLITDLMNFIK